MDRQNLVEELKKAFSNGQEDGGAEDTDVEFRENTNTLVLKSDRVYQMNSEPQEKKMSEEEVFERLLRDRRQQK